MLRITAEETADHGVRLRIEGRLAGPWVEALESAAADSRPAQGGLQLDLSGLRYADERGLALLLSLAEQGARLERVSPFIRELLDARPG
jgi:ABC-type transporter Mla MlaB component